MSSGHAILSSLLEWPVHTTRAVIDLLYSGSLERYTNIRYILAHGGRAVPYLAHRIAAGRGTEGRVMDGDRAGEPNEEGEFRAGPRVPDSFRGQIRTRSLLCRSGRRSAMTTPSGTPRKEQLVDGRYVGDPEFDPLMADLNERSATVLPHPNELAVGNENAPLYPWAEYPIHLARSWSRLILSGTLSTYRDIDWVLGHAGGVVPFLAERLGKLHYVQRGKPRWGRILLDLALHRNGGLELAERVAYDTVGAANPLVHAALERLGQPDSIRFGSNFPFETEAAIQGALEFFATHPLHPRPAPTVNGAGGS